MRRAPKEEDRGAFVRIVAGTRVWDRRRFRQGTGRERMRRQGRAEFFPAPSACGGARCHSSRYFKMRASSPTGQTRMHSKHWPMFCAEKVIAHKVRVK